MKEQERFGNNFEELIKDFFNYLKEEEISIYNEFSFQHELGIYLRNVYHKNYKIEFERNANKHLHINYDKLTDSNEERIKEEMDIYIYNKNDISERYAIELKYPLNGQVPEQMYQFAKDIKFMQFLKNKGFSKTYCIVLTDNKNFYMGQQKGRIADIYKYFRSSREPLTGKIEKPTGKYQKDRPFIHLEKEYPIVWNSCEIIQTNYDIKTKSLISKINECRYFIIECE